MNICKDPVAAVSGRQMTVLDPTGERKALFDYRRSARSVKPGDIVRVTFKSGDPFSGVCLAIRLRGVDTSFLLRNQLTRVGVEMWIKAYSPNVEGVEIVQRTEKRKRRARLYYMRYAPPPPICYSDLYIYCSVLTNVDAVNPSMIWAAWRILSAITSARSRLWQGASREFGDRAGRMASISVY